MNSDDLYKPINPFKRPREKLRKGRKIKRYDNPFAKKARKSKERGMNMSEIMSSKENGISLKSDLSVIEKKKERRRRMNPAERLNVRRIDEPEVRREVREPDRGVEKQPADLAKDIFGDNPMAQMGMNYTKNFVESSVNNMNASSWARQAFNSSIKGYFEIDNSYLMRKLRHIIFPFLSKVGQSQPEIQAIELQNSSQGDNSIFRSDLYIPLMAFVTYVLLSCLSLGLDQNFKPDIILRNASNCALLTIFETVILKIGIIVANNMNIGYFDILALSGYRYLGMCLIVVFHIFNWISFVRYSVYPLQIYLCSTSFVNTFLTLKYLSGKITAENVSAAINQDSKKLKIVSFGLGGVQVVFTWILLYISF